LLLLAVLLAACQPATPAPLAGTPRPETTAGPAAPQTGLNLPVATVVSAAGEIQAAVEEYRALLGPDNGGEPTRNETGRREINWDGLPDELAAPNDYAPDFFNDTQAPRARGLVLSTPGTALVVSADSDNPTNAAVRFGHINPAYSAIFKTFSPERLFSPVGSNIVDLHFFLPGTQTPALVRGFGAVYTDVDLEHTAFEYFDQQGNSLGRFSVPVADQGLSFLGVAFADPIVFSVRVEYGSASLGPADTPENDVAVMDDFIYGEPQPIPAP
jgi:hypothetical protein